MKDYREITRPFALCKRVWLCETTLKWLSEHEGKKEKMRRKKWRGKGGERKGRKKGGGKKIPSGIGTWEGPSISAWALTITPLPKLAKVVRRTYNNYIANLDFQLGPECGLACCTHSAKIANQSLHARSARNNALKLTKLNATFLYHVS